MSVYFSSLSLLLFDAFEGPFPASSLNVFNINDGEMKRDSLRSRQTCLCNQEVALNDAISPTLAVNNNVSTKGCVTNPFFHDTEEKNKKTKRKKFHRRNYYLLSLLQEVRRELIKSKSARITYLHDRVTLMSKRILLLQSFKLETRRGILKTSISHGKYRTVLQKVGRCSLTSFISRR